MDNLYTSRIELKTLISRDNFELLKKFIEEEFEIIRPDEQYFVKTMYLCQWRHENQKGKIRIRIYNDKKIFIEEKKKVDGKSYKQRYELSFEIYQKYKKISTLNDLFLLNHELNFLFDEQYLNYGSFQKLQISYERQIKHAFCNEQPLRITFDHNLFLIDCDIPDFQTVPLLPEKLIVMELKGNNVKAFVDRLEEVFNITMRPFSKFKLASCY